MNFGYYQKLAKRTNDNNIHLVNLENCNFCYGREFTSKEIEAFLMTGQPLRMRTGILGYLYPRWKSTNKKIKKNIIVGME